MGEREGRKRGERERERERERDEPMYKLLIMQVHVFAICPSVVIGERCGHHKPN